MSVDDPQAPEELFASSLAAYHEGLATDSTLTFAPDTPTDLNAESVERLKRAQECVRLLSRLWPQPELAAEVAQFLGTPSETSQPQVTPSRLGRFQIVSKLGRGAFGIVFLAIDPALGRRIALKLPRPETLVTPELRRRFLREAQAAGALNHPNLVSVFETGEVGPVCYIAEEYCDGKTLAAWLRERGAPVPPKVAARLLATLAEAMDYAHNHGILHRDLKPSNVMLEARPAKTGETAEPGIEGLEFIPKITDFGVAKLLEGECDETRTGGILGTPAYMAPEQAEGRVREIGRQTDVYSLGVILYEMLTGQPPIAGVTDLETLRRVITEEPAPLRRRCPSIPIDLEAICLKCLEKSRADRYASGALLAEDLHRFLTGHPTHARPLGSIRRTLKWVRRRPALAGLLAVSLLATLVLVVGSWWHALRLQHALEIADSSRIDADRQRDLARRQEILAREREGHMRRYLYAADMRQAFAAWNSSHLSEMLDLLERHRPMTAGDDLRSFAWYYLWGLCHNDLLTLRGHSREVHCVTFSPDGRLLATASFDGTAKLWDAATGKERATLLNGHKEELNAVAFSPDGKTLATGGDDRAVRLWEIDRRQQRAVLLGHTDDVNTVAFSPDGKMLASGGLDRIVKLWDVSTGKEIAALAGHRGAVEALAFSPDGKTLATSSGDKTAILWNLVTKKPRTVLRGHANRADQTDVVYAVAFAHDGRTVATGSEDRTIRLWDADSGQEKATLRGHSEVVRCVVFSPGDQTLAAALCDGSVWLWDVATHKLRRTIRGHVGRIWSAAYSRDGQSFATAGSDRTVRIWRSDVNQAARYVSGLPSRIEDFNLRSDDKLLAVSYSRPAGRTPPPELWEIGSTIVRRSLQLPDCRNVGLAPAGNALAVRTGTAGPSHIDLYDGPPWRLHAAFDSREPPRCLVWSPDGRTIATASTNGTIRLWEAASAHQRAMLRKQDRTGFYAIAFSPDGATLASGDFAGMLTRWDLDGLQERSAVQAHAGTVFALAFAPDGRMLATGAGDRMIKIWDADKWHERATLQGHRDAVRCAAFSPDGKTLASGSDDGTIRLWDTYTLQELIVLEAHGHGVGQLAFTADGRTLVSMGTSANGTGEVAFWSGPLQHAAFVAR